MVPLCWLTLARAFWRSLRLAYLRPSWTGLADGLTPQPIVPEACLTRCYSTVYLICKLSARLDLRSSTCLFVRDKTPCKTVDFCWHIWCAAPSLGHVVLNDIVSVMSSDLLYISSFSWFNFPFGFNNCKMLTVVYYTMSCSHQGPGFASSSLALDDILETMPWKQCNDNTTTNNPEVSLRGN